MEQTILEKIKSYHTIIIHRHNRPDFDAYGSQLGLASLLKLNFTKKNVYVVGDDSSYPYPHQMDIISDETYNGALAFILDTCEMKLVSDDRYKLAKECPLRRAARACTDGWAPRRSRRWGRFRRRGRDTLSARDRSRARRRRGRG